MIPYFNRQCFATLLDVKRLSSELVYSIIPPVEKSNFFFSSLFSICLLINLKIKTAFPRSCFLISKSRFKVVFLLIRLMAGLILATISDKYFFIG